MASSNFASTQNQMTRGLNVTGMRAGSGAHGPQMAVIGVNNGAVNIPPRGQPPRNSQNGRNS